MEIEVDVAKMVNDFATISVEDSVQPNLFGDQFHLRLTFDVKPTSRKDSPPPHQKPGIPAEEELAPPEVRAPPDPQKGLEELETVMEGPIDLLSVQAQAESKSIERF